uniref:Uncharacterized protein n=1 Tax=Romanomermis culicivorax TaxID=13658 RepID=A0A915L2J9_ROMCU
MTSFITCVAFTEATVPIKKLMDLYSIRFQRIDAAAGKYSLTRDHEVNFDNVGVAPQRHSNKQMLKLLNRKYCCTD